ncbi:MAG: hypothetical protein RRB13_11165 [bacterium]|nr:hypothetical protein [bacterium]
MKKLLILLLFAMAMGACSMGGDDMPRQQVRQACAEPRLASSFKFHDRALDYLRTYFKTRKETDLFFAWYASEDSLYMARTINRCYDKRNKHFHAVRNVIQKNEVLRKLIVQNMRTDSQAEVSELFLDEYRKIFVRDIQ